MPTIVPDIDLEALNFVPRCPVCRRAYTVRRVGKERTIQPDHTTWCRNRRTTTQEMP